MKEKTQTEEWSLPALLLSSRNSRGPAESNDYLWDRVCLIFLKLSSLLVVLPFKFWSFGYCIHLHRKEKTGRKPKGSINESIFELFFFKLTFSSCKFYATASFDISHTWSSGNACAFQISSSLPSQQLRSQIDILLKLTFWSLTSIHTPRKSHFNAQNSSSIIDNI